MNSVSSCIYFFWQLTMSTILDNLLSTKSSYSTDPIDRYIFDHSLRYTTEQCELLEDIKNLPGMKIYLLVIK